MKQEQSGVHEKHERHEIFTNILRVFAWLRNDRIPHFVFFRVFRGPIVFF